MGQPVTLEAAFGGMRRDEPRDLLPDGALWNCVDFVPQSLGAPLRKRGAWTYASPSITGASYIDGMCRTPSYGAGAFNVLVGSNGGVWSFTDNTSTSLGTAFTVKQNPFVHRSSATTWLVVIPAGDGTTAPKSWDGTTFGNLAGSPPAAIYGDVWYDRGLLANGTVGGTRYAGRLWVSTVGNSASWDTTNAWYDFSEPVVGLATMRTACLIFHRRSTERLRNPSGAEAIFVSSTQTGNLIQDRPFEIGCADARSIVKYNDTVIWADITGVYQSDGIYLKDLTKFGGMATFWFDTILNLDTNYTLAAGVVHDTYIISIMNGTTFVDCWAYDLLRNYWYRFSNMLGRCFMRVPGDTAEKVYMGLANAGRVASHYVLYHPDSQIAADADGTTILPLIETPFFRGWQRMHRRWVPSLALQQWKNLYTNYQLVDGGAAPILTASYVTDPISTSYTALAPTFAAAANYTRARIDLGFQSSGLGLKYVQTGASLDTRFHGFEAEYDQLEPSRLAQ